MTATSFRARLDSVLVFVRSDLSGVPEIALPPGYEIRAMDMGSGSDIATWLAIHNDAYGHEWDEDNYRRAILEHPYLTVQHTFFAVDKEVPVGAASVGTYRGNEKVAVGHYLGVMRRAQRRGLANALVAHRYAVMRDAGFTACESQTHLGRTGSLLIHFECGFQPKPRRDRWNNPANAPKPFQVLANRRLRALYRSWRHRPR
jgi:GNAT superfamily N-acetyltransferase